MLKESIAKFINDHPYLCMGIIFITVAAVGLAGVTSNPWAALLVLGIGGAVLTGIAHDFG